MAYEPTIDAPIPLFRRKEAHGKQTSVQTGQRGTTSPVSARDTGRSQPLAQRRPLRFGGLLLDALTGRAEWCGKPLALCEGETEVLHMLMRNAGRIVSLERLAAQLGEQPERVEERLRALHGSLRVAGVKCLPRHTNGLGYILWY